MMQSPQYRLIFPDTRVGVNGWQCKTSLIEYANHSGSFRNTTTLGSINGLGVIDDPVKGRAEAARWHRKFALYRRVDKAPIANSTLLTITALVLILACTACHITRISKVLRCCIICSELSLAQIVPPAVRLFGFA
jgi:hypothetical protein